MLLTKDEEKTLDELITQFERNFKKVETNSGASQEALMAKANNFKKADNLSYNKNKRNNDICNYCHKKCHWLINCIKWMADNKPSKNKNVEVNTYNE